MNVISYLGIPLALTSAATAFLDIKLSFQLTWGFDR
jgi:hypothetical protein